ncbi:7204_t:CDS:2 [Funneliformis mosseae]|uniref:7204_t:CDS:1 n=1 Tax=Funneliformis mosseae TaxID=27381 RepID=A0A9N9DHS8_FUNMO|nr:7204_t:CDS:2 [Funneliformis mosseae]
MNRKKRIKLFMMIIDTTGITFFVKLKPIEIQRQSKLLYYPLEFQLEIWGLFRIWSDDIY